jgi:hypothetical protein
MDKRLVYKALEHLEYTEEMMIFNANEALRSVCAGVQTEKSVEPILKKLNLRLKVRGLIRHDRTLAKDKRGVWYV